MHVDTVAVDSSSSGGGGGDGGGTGRGDSRAVAEAITFGPDLLVDRGAVLAGACFLVGFVAEVLQFDEEVVGSEELAETKKRDVGVPVSSGVDEVADLAMPAARQADETLPMLPQATRG